MDILPSSVQNSVFFQFASTRFQDAYRTGSEPWWEKLATKHESKSSQNVYAWSSRVPQLRKWIGERAIRSIAAYSQTVVNDAYELTTDISRPDYEDDMYGVFTYGIEDLARAAKKWPDTMLVNVLRNGSSTLSWDGANFFSATHPKDAFNPQLTGNQQNYWSTGTALTFDNYQTVRATMMSYVGEDGLPLGVIPDLLVVPPQLEVTARLICEAESVAPQTLGAITQAGANTNVLRNSAKVLVIPELAVDATKWYLLDTGSISGRSIKPFLYQVRKEPQLVTINNPSETYVFKNNKFAFGVDSRGAAAGTLWFLAAKAVA